MDHLSQGRPRDVTSGGSLPGPASPVPASRSGTLRRAAALLLAGLVAAGCTTERGGSAADARERETGFRGIVLPEPPRMPPVVLTDTDGDPFDLRARTRGSVTLLFFGYTHCPDVCPVQMANLAAVLDELRPSVRSGIQVVFVSTDPERDTPERLRSWLDRRDPAFIGLRGPMETVNETQRALGLASAVVQEDDGSADGYRVGHASQVLAFTPDGRGRLAYPFGTRQIDWLHDLPILVREGWSGGG